MKIYKAQKKYRENYPEKVKKMSANWQKRNPEKRAEIARRYRLKHPEKVKAYKKKWDKTQKARICQHLSYIRQKEKCRAFLNDLKNHPCSDCYNSYPPECMDFDHVRGTKLGNPGQMYTWSKEKLLMEISKCDLVCSNCHRIRTFRKKKEDGENTTVQTEGSQT